MKALHKFKALVRLGDKGQVQDNRREFYIYIHLDYIKVEFYIVYIKKKYYSNYYNKIKNKKLLSFF